MYCPTLNLLFSKGKSLEKGATKPALQPLVSGYGSCGSVFFAVKIVSGEFTNGIFKFVVELEYPIGILVYFLSSFGKTNSIVGSIKKTGIKMFF